MGKTSKQDKSEEDRLLEKAKRFVEQQEERERKKNGGSRGDGRGRDRDRDHHKASRRHHKDHSRDGDEDDSRGGRKREHHRGGSRRKRKERSRSRSRDRSERDRKHKKRHRHDGDDMHDRHRRKRDDKRDRDDKKEHRKKKKKHSKRHDGGGHEKARVDLSKLVPLGPVASSPPTDQIDAEADYFAYHQHFRLYLYRSCGTYFEDLASTDAHREFASFAEEFNAGKLEEAYYGQKLPTEALEQCKRTQHKWAFKTNTTEQQSLEMVRAGVKKQTEWSGGAAVNDKPIAAKQSISAGPTMVLPQRTDNIDNGRRRKAPEEMAAERAANRRLREHVKTAHEELTGGRADYGRERRLEKRKEKAEKLHGSAKDREAEAMGGPDLDDEALYGGGRTGGGESFQEAIAREKARKAKREQKNVERIGELQAKEDAKAKAMLDMLGLSGIKPGQKIQIQPRKDG